MRILDTADSSYYHRWMTENLPHEMVAQEPAKCFPLPYSNKRMIREATIKRANHQFLNNNQTKIYKEK